MKIYMLLMLVGAFVGFSYFPVREQTKAEPSAGAGFDGGVLPKA